jgi:hypothetical protein
VSRLGDRFHASTHPTVARQHRIQRQSSTLFFLAIVALLANSVAILVTVHHNTAIYGILNIETFYEKIGPEKRHYIPSFHKDLALRSAGRLIMRVHCIQ